nr:hypothetical protein BaRGS_032227 [Batillaria attramentaria]
MRGGQDLRQGQSFRGNLLKVTSKLFDVLWERDKLAVVVVVVVPPAAVLVAGKASDAKAASVTGKCSKVASDASKSHGSLAVVTSPGGEAGDRSRFVIATAVLRFREICHSAIIRFDGNVHFRTQLENFGQSVLL